MGRLPPRKSDANEPSYETQKRGAKADEEPRNNQRVESPLKGTLRLTWDTAPPRAADSD